MKLVTEAILKALRKTPYGSQDGSGRGARVIARYFVAHCTWYVLEDESYEKTGTVYGLANLGHGWEYGPFSIPEIGRVSVPVSVRNMKGEVISIGLAEVERDRFVRPLKMTLGECERTYGENFDEIA